MRIDRLELRAFGAFTDGPTLDFSQGGEGVHLVYGPNEAGKSTALRALVQALYGIPSRSTDDFIHPYAKLRIGMAIRSDNTRLAFVRRKGTVSTVREYDDETKALDESRLTELLGGFDLRLFQTLFGLHHQDLVSGGQEILGGGGEIGHALFAAASGLSQVRAVQEALAEEADALFSPRASRPLLNGLIASFKAKSAELKGAIISTQSWLEKEGELKKADRCRLEAENAFSEVDKALRRVDRFRQALPLLTQYKGLIATLKELKDAPRLREDFASTWRAALNGLEVASQGCDRLEAKLKANRATRGNLHLDSHLLAQGETIEALWRDINRVVAAHTDMSRMLGEVQSLEQDVRRLLAQLRPSAPLEDASTVQLEPAIRRDIQRLANSHAAVVRELERSNEEYEQVLLNQAALQEAVARDESFPDTRPLEEVVKRARQAGDLESRRDSFQRDAERLAVEAGKLLTRLGAGWNGTLDILERTPVPEDETVAQFARELDTAASSLAQCMERCSRLEGECAEQEQLLARSEAEGSLPSESDLSQRRQARDTGWRLVRRQWEALHPPNDIADDDIKQFAVEMGTPDNLADAFSASVTIADETADTLRQESSRVAQRVQLEQSLNGIRLNVARAQQERSEALSVKEEVQRAWSNAWNNTGIAPLSPREMESWLRRREKLLELAGQERDDLAEAEKTAAAIVRHMGELRNVLDVLGGKTPASEASLTQWIDCADLAVKDAVSRSRAQAERQEALSRLLRDVVPAAQRTHELSEKAMSGWNEAWTKTMGAMALPADTDVETAQDIADIHAETAKKWEQFQTQHKRVEEMTRFAEDFSARTQALCDHVAQDLRDRPAEQALQELYMRFQSVQDAEKERLRLHEEQESLQQEFDQATDSVARFRAQLDQACNEARVGNVELIPEAESQASARRNLEQELAQLEERLADFAAGENMNDFIAALDAEDPDSLTTRGEELNRDLDRLREDREGHINAAAELRVRFESLNLHEESIHAAEALEGLKAESEEAIDRYVRLKAAEAVLQVAMERYRRDNQDPLLKRTAEIFRELTLSSFVDLRTDLDDRGRQVLVGIRNSDESVVGVEGMSDGTTDQLFLALRLASIEQYAEKGKALPFIADDILVNFDDARAIAALKVLAEVSRKVQIIFFTHHQHLLELAKTAVPATALFVSTLG